MGIISLEKQDHLFWLGRYSERAFTTIHTFLLGYDEMLDGSATTYKTICERLDIPDIYGDQNTFIKTYLYSEEDPNSVHSNLKHAYDNAVVLRDEISSESLSYIQMALDSLERVSREPLNLLNLQLILDDLFAFWGSVDDYVQSNQSRDIMKCGRYLERMDLYIRLDYGTEALMREFEKMDYRFSRLTAEQYDVEKYKRFASALKGNRALKGQLDNLNTLVLR